MMVTSKPRHRFSKSGKQSKSYMIKLIKIAQHTVQQLSEVWDTARCMSIFLGLSPRQAGLEFFSVPKQRPNPPTRRYPVKIAQDEPQAVERMMYRIK